MIPINPATFAYPKSRPGFRSPYVVDLFCAQLIELKGDWLFFRYLWIFLPRLIKYSFHIAVHSILSQPKFYTGVRVGRLLRCLI